MKLYDHVMLEADLIVDRLDDHHGIAKVPQLPGWGLQLDEAALQKYATQPTIKMNN